MSIFKNLFAYKKAKAYSLTKTMNDSRKNEGRDYSKDILSRSISGHIQRKDLMQNFLGFIQDMIVNAVRAVTSLKIFKAYAMPKDYHKVK